MEMEGSQHTVCVSNDSFSIKYIKQANLDHLIHAHEKHYDMALGGVGKEVVKITLDWDYKEQDIDETIF